MNLAELKKKIGKLCRGYVGKKIKIFKKRIFK